MIQVSQFEKAKVKKMNRLQKIQEIKKLANEPPKFDYSIISTPDLEYSALIWLRYEGGELKKTDIEFKKAIKYMETKYKFKYYPIRYDQKREN